MEWMMKAIMNQREGCYFNILNSAEIDIEGVGGLQRSNAGVEKRLDNDWTAGSMLLGFHNRQGLSPPANTLTQSCTSTGILVADLRRPRAATLLERAAELARFGGEATPRSGRTAARDSDVATREWRSGVQPARWVYFPPPSQCLTPNATVETQTC